MAIPPPPFWAAPAPVNPTMDKSMEDISMSWEPVLVNVKETLHVLFPAPPTLALGENTEAGMEPEARRSLPEVLLLKSSELIEVEEVSPTSDVVFTVTVSREVPVRLKVVEHNTAAWETAVPKVREAMSINDFFITRRGWMKTTFIP